MDAAEHWEAWRRALGDGGLVSYRYLGCSSQARGRHAAIGRLRLRSDLRTPGGLLAAPLGIALLDTAGINVDAIARCVPTRIDVTVFGPSRDVQEVVIFGTVVREGRTQMFTEGRLEDAAVPGRVLGFGATSWAVVGPAPPGYEYVDPGPGVPEAGDLPPFVEAFGATRRAVGAPAYELAGLSPRVGAGALHQGPIQAMLEAAALDAARDAAGHDTIYAAHTGATIVRPGTAGPFVATAVVLHCSRDTVACRSQLRDDGVGGRVVATALSLYRAAPGDEDRA